MSTSIQSAGGNFHVQIKLHGDPGRVRLFHAMIKQVEPDWGYYESRWATRGTYRPRASVCKFCKGIVVSNPRIGPQDLKAAASQCGIGCKIYNFAKSEKCGDAPILEWIERAYVPVLYSHKPGRINLMRGFAWVGDAVPEELRKQQELEAMVVQ